MNSVIIKIYWLRKIENICSLKITCFEFLIILSYNIVGIEFQKYESQKKKSSVKNSHK